MIRLICKRCNETAYGKPGSGLCASCAGMQQYVQFDGLDLYVHRDNSGAIRISVETGGLELSDEHPLHSVPKLRLQVNDGPIMQMDKDGDWVQGDGYPDTTVLDHLAAIE